ncbi:hypothetical protein FDG50_03255 [Clostridium botulinum]|uniref:hypothetical protein n=1 Tax=Clostridium botulinum TaxID=1491 RepID=UPI0013FF30BA|nr:hypothetical protein [Clostridium botulinum]MBY6836547.1 hypothetical protein [Clostridium botulinum]NFG64170.1 hypothetical protein [Clostridium botulinum]NFQ23163.1 hypothetical protein [Clostridium botulinum]
MKYLEFDSLYKFIISIGIIFILSPFVIFYLLFNKNIDLLISKSEFDKLTQTSQEIVDIKQNLFLNIINSNKYYILAFSMVVLGILLIGFGIYGWKKAQGQVDLKYVLENEKLKKEIGISTEEKRIQVEEEINNDKKILGNDNHSTVYEYMEIEKRLFTVINKDFRVTHEVIQNAKIGECEYDIIATGKNLLAKDYIFEVKYIKGNINDRWISRVLEQIYKKTNNYSDATNHLPYRMLIIITEKENYNEVENKMKKIDKKNNFRIIIEQKSKIKYLKFN